MKPLKYSIIKSKDQFQQYCDQLEELTKKADQSNSDEIIFLNKTEKL